MNSVKCSRWLEVLPWNEVSQASSAYSRLQRTLPHTSFCAIDHGSNTNRPIWTTEILPMNKLGQPYYFILSLHFKYKSISNTSTEKYALTFLVNCTISEYTVFSLLIKDIFSAIRKYGKHNDECQLTLGFRDNRAWWGLQWIGKYRPLPKVTSNFSAPADGCHRRLKAGGASSPVFWGKDSG